MLFEFYEIWFATNTGIINEQSIQTKAPKFVPSEVSGAHLSLTINQYNNIKSESTLVMWIISLNILKSFVWYHAV